MESAEAAQPTAEKSAGADLYVLPETDLEEILRELESLRPNVAVIDSIQTIYLPALTSAPGSVAQVRNVGVDASGEAGRHHAVDCGTRYQRSAIAGPRY